MKLLINGSVLKTGVKILLKNLAFYRNWTKIRLHPALKEKHK
jgi:hypothetical protein